MSWSHCWENFTTQRESCFFSFFFFFYRFYYSRAQIRSEWQETYCSFAVLSHSVDKKCRKLEGEILWHLLRQFIVNRIFLWPVLFLAVNQNSTSTISLLYQAGFSPGFRGCRGRCKVGHHSHMTDSSLERQGLGTFLGALAYFWLVKRQNRSTVCDFISFHSGKGEVSVMRDSWS